MGTIPVLPMQENTPSCVVFGGLGRPLPANYMSDYSVVGLLVENLDEAVRILQANRYSVTANPAGVDVAVTGPEDLRRLTRVLADRGMRFQVADLVGGIYQG